MGHPYVSIGMKKKNFMLQSTRKWQILIRMKYVLCSVGKGNTNNMMKKVPTLFPRYCTGKLRKAKLSHKILFECK